MKRLISSFAKALLKWSGESPEPPSHQDRSIHQENSQTGVIGDTVNVNGGIHFHGPDGKLRPEAEILAIYRRDLVASFQHLPLRGISKEASDPSAGPRKMALDQVYVALDTRTQVEKSEDEKNREKKEQGRVRDEHRPLSALEAAVRNLRLVILGDPGSGKSTFLNHLTLCLAMHSEQSDVCERLGCWPRELAELVPVPVVMRDFAVWLQQRKRKNGADPGHLWAYIAHHLERRRMEPVTSVLERLLDDGKVIVLLDGLDEIPDHGIRVLVRDAVASFAKRYGDCRFIVTCRVLSYQNEKWRLDAEDFPQVELAPFDEKKISAFISAWYADLQRLNMLKQGEHATYLAESLNRAVRRPDLWRLAPNPLLLTVMALVHAHMGRLPDARALLYEETVDILLWRWEQVKRAGEKETPQIQTLLNQAGRMNMDLIHAISQLAFRVHERSRPDDAETRADIPEHELQKALKALHPEKSTDWADEMIRAIKMRAGLLVEREGEVFSFPHRTFQEYLAGSWLASQPEFARRATELVEQGNFWREVVLMAVGRLVYVGRDTEKPLLLAMTLCPRETGDMETDWRKIWMAGETLLEIGRNRVEDSELGREILSRVRERLLRLVEKGRLTPKERVAAGNALGRLDDPRFDPERWYLPRGNDGFVAVAEGEFWMGADKSVDTKADGDESPRHRVRLSAYEIGRYPVTVAQFQAFLADAGYVIDDSNFERYNRYANHPVVMVSWNDANAYCDWLSKKLDRRIALPTEAQWERAARDEDERRYPWGNEEMEPDRGNYGETGIRGTSPVGCFPAGAAHSGALDLAGNVWEWCADWYGKYPSEAVTDPTGPAKGASRVLRGGAWLYVADCCRTASRFRFGPGYRYDNLGFRLVRLPGQPGQ